MVRISGVVAAGLALAAGVEAHTKPDVINLPQGFFPEGTANGRGWTIYVGSFGDGRIWKGDLKTGEGEVVVPEASSMATGLEYDKRSGYLFVCGGLSGTIRIYDDDFKLVADMTLTATDGTAFINDVIVTKDAAYFTDSYQAQYYKLPIDMETGELTATTTETIRLSDNFTLVPGQYNANGIEVCGQGQILIIVNMYTGELWNVLASTGEARLIDLGGALLIGGDGLVLRGDTLWVVQTGFFGSNMQINEISLSADYMCGSVSDRVLTKELFDYPTTVIRKANNLYTVNSKFGVEAEDVASTPYEIVRVDRDWSGYICSS